MTLVIAGHNVEFEQFVWGDSDSKFLKRANGLYVATDSAITTETTHGRKTLLNGFKKVYEVPIKVWKPYFVDKDFKAYHEVYIETSCFVAIAGNTLTAQHILNSIYNHLSRLRISCEDNPRDLGIEYTILRPCQKNILEDRTQTVLWDYDTFLDSDFEKLLTAEVIAENLLHSMQTAVNSAREYKLDENDFRSLFTEFVAGIYCPVTKKHQLICYRMSPIEDGEGLLNIRIVPEEVPEGQTAVIGLRSRYEAEANQIVADCIAREESQMQKIFELLNRAIDEERESRSKEIDRPSIMRVFQSGKLEIINRLED